MKTVKKILIFSLGFAFLFAFAVLGFQKPVSAFAKTTSAKATCVIDVESGEILFAENENAHIPMASTTKILTAIIIIENMDLSQKIKVGNNAVGVEGSSIYLKKDEEIAVIDLLYGLMLRSGNDSAVALAISCAGSVESFAKMMNEKAKQIGAVSSSFVNPHGLDDENHFTTAKDLALISAYAMKNEIFRKIVSTKMHVVPSTNVSDVRYLQNKNKLLSSFDGACGIKTGYTKKTGRCLVSAAEREGKTLVCVVLSCPNMWEDSKNLLNFCFDKIKKQ